MARHRRRPAFRLKGRTQDGQPPSAAPRDWRVGAAVRRVVVTPTFAAGLGVVIAAVLAYPMSRTVFKYSGPGWGGQTCPSSGCIVKHHEGGRPALAKPGQRLPAPEPTTPAPPPAQSPQPAHTTESPTPPPSPSGAPVMSYQTVHEWDGGFQGQITVTFSGSEVPPRWGLWFMYPQGRIFGVAGGRWQRRGDHKAVVINPTEGEPPAPGNSIQIEFWVAGDASPPPACSFDNQACQFG